MQTSMDTILQHVKDQEHERAQAQMRAGLLGPPNMEMQYKMQVEMIGRVFLNMLAAVGHKENDPRMKQLAESVREVLETRSYTGLMGSKVPHFKADIINLLRVVDMSEEDRANLVSLGFSELYANP
jgi:hypothetical protein